MRAARHPTTALQGPQISFLATPPRLRYLQPATGADVPRHASRADESRIGLQSLPMLKDNRQ